MIRWIFTCEHAGNEVPAPFREHFRRANRVLESHRGYDIGALEVLRTLARETDFARFNTVSRQVVDLNRSETNPSLFSKYTRHLDDEVKERIIDEIYRPYRLGIEERIGRLIARGDFVIHLSVHSFTPVLNGIVRKTDIGLMYDPKRAVEKTLCGRWRGILRKYLPGLTIRMNYPYRGVSDGITAAMRKHFTRNYAGLEIEVNQKHLVNGMDRDLIDSVAVSLEQLRRSRDLLP